MTKQICTSNDAFKAGLTHADTDNTRQVLNNADLYSFSLGMFNSTLMMASGKTGDIIEAMSTKAFATTDIFAKQAQSKNIALTSATIQIIAQNASLLSLAGKAHPGAAMATVGAMLATKTSIALGMAGGDDKKAACIAAFADIAAAGLSLTAGIVTSGTGVGLILVASSLSQLALGGYKAHQACLDKK